MKNVGIGDKVMCVNSLNSLLTLGKTYIVLDNFPDCVRVRNDNDCVGYYPNYRFRVVNSFYRSCKRLLK